MSESIRVHKVGVREIIEFIMRSGDITSVSLSSTRLVDGTKAHTQYQKKQREKFHYHSEVSVSHTFERGGRNYRISGRIDGVFEEGDDERGGMVLDEIKSTSLDLADVIEGQSMHWAQVFMYAYMLTANNPIIDKSEIITCRLTYIELDRYDEKRFYEEKTFEELELFFNQVMDAYDVYMTMLDAFESAMYQSIDALVFPFTNKRFGQSRLMKGVYRTVKEGQILFSRAPTGIGKTIATLFPAIKGIGDASTDKVFYLTAKNIGKEVAVKTIELIKEQGLKIKYTVITAKDKCCIHDVTRCKPDECPYAKGHYDRINAAIKNIYEDDVPFTREVIDRYARKHQVCPYEFSLDLALFSQVIICDYNYAFDPSAMLKRFFAEGEGRYTLLVDEAHNLVDRSRSMYSASLNKSSLMSLKRHVKSLDPRLHTYMEQMNKEFLVYKKQMKDRDELTRIDEEIPDRIEPSLRGIIHRTEKIFKLHRHWEHMEQLLEFYFNVYDFLKKYELYGEHYRTIYERKVSDEGKTEDVTLKLFCVDPRRNLRDIVKDMQGVVYFSATLLPMNYYRYLLGGDTTSYGLDLASPFDPKHLNLMMDATLSTKYMDRERTLEDLVTRMVSFVLQRTGNYLLFFPSYRYMRQALDVFEPMIDNRVDMIVQHSQMSDEEKESFVKAFDREQRNKSLVGFAVLGGMFGEGIDLVGDRLVGAVIVGVGLPMIGMEQNIVKDYFEKRMGQGFEFAYTYPGMNKVLQAAGRVIRTETDKGSVLLIDRRFRSRTYEGLYPNEWYQRRFIRSLGEMREINEEFWRES